MPCILKIRVISARGLPIMDRITELTDAYVSVRHGDNEEQRTRICRKSLNPVWNEDFRFEVSDDSQIQTEPLELKVMDFDQISRNDPIGQISLDLNPLISVSTVGSVTNAPQIQGWFPIYDSLKGVRGELNVLVRLEYFGDRNPFKDSSAGVQFFSITSIPPGMQLISILDFVEELVLDSDPEYDWSDKIRATRVSNDVRQRKLFELAGRVRKVFGKKVLDMGGNAVLGYRFCFDLEKEEGGIVARGIGVACKLVNTEDLTMADLQELLPALQPQKLQQIYQIQQQLSDERSQLSFESLQQQKLQFQQQIRQLQANPAASAPSQLSLALQAREAFSTSPPTRPSASKDEDLVASIQLPPPSMQAQQPAPLLGSVSRERSTSVSNVGGGGNSSLTAPDTAFFGADAALLGTTPEVTMQSLLALKGTKKAPATLASDVQLHTLDSLVEGQVLRLGALVSARSVKVLMGDDQEIRDAWWIELREEIRSHARTLGCQAVIGYSEVTTIHDEIIVLSATGTAATLSIIPGLTGTLPFMSQDQEDQGGQDSSDEEDANPSSSSYTGNHSWKATANPRSPPRRPQGFPLQSSTGARSCASCHFPFTEEVNPPFRMEFAKCAVCNQALVPELVIATVEPPPELETVGPSFFIEANVMKSKRKKEGEYNAAEVSKLLPFVEYEIYQQLRFKMKLLGVNAIFGLKYELTLGEAYLVAVASGNAMFLAPLPLPKVLEITYTPDPSDEEGKQKLELYQKITQVSEQNIKAMRDRLKEKALSSEVLRLVPSKVPGQEDEALEHPPERKNSLDNTRGFRAPEEGEDDERTNFVVRVEDETDEDLMNTLLDPIPQDKLFTFNSTTFLRRTLLRDPDKSLALYNLQEVTLLKKWHIKNPSQRMNRFIFSFLQNMREELLFSFRPHGSFCVCGLSYDISLPKDGEIQILLKGMSVGYREVDPPSPAPPALLRKALDAADRDDDDTQFHMDHPEPAQLADEPPVNQVLPSAMVDITPLNNVPGAEISLFLGRANFFLVKETVNLQEMHGIGNFTHVFLTEAKAIARAHVVALVRPFFILNFALIPLDFNSIKRFCYYYHYFGSGRRATRFWVSVLTSSSCMTTRTRTMPTP